MHQHIFWIYVHSSLVCVVVVKCIIISLIVSDATGASVPCGRSSSVTIGITALRCIDAVDLLTTDMQWQLITRLCLNRIGFQIFFLITQELIKAIYRQLLNTFNNYRANRN